MPDVELRVVNLEGAVAYQNGRVLGPQLMNVHQRAGGGEQGRAAAVAQAVNVAVAAFGPFQGDVGPSFGLKGNEAPVEFQTFLFADAYRYVDAGFAHYADAASLHFGKGVDAAHHDARYAGAYDEACAWRRAAEVCARLQTDIEGGVA